MVGFLNVSSLIISQWDSAAQCAGIPLRTQCLDQSCSVTKHHSKRDTFGLFGEMGINTEALWGKETENTRIRAECKSWRKFFLQFSQKKVVMLCSELQWYPLQGPASLATSLNSAFSSSIGLCYIWRQPCRICDTSSLFLQRNTQTDWWEEWGKKR